MKLLGSLVLALIIVVFGESAAKSDNVSSVQQILSAFAGTCPSQGSWTQNAISQSLSLAAVLDSIKSDPNCASDKGFALLDDFSLSGMAEGYLV